MIPKTRFDLGIGMPAPYFRLRSLSGGFRELKEWRGRRVILFFVQPHCLHSRQVLSVIAGLSPDPAGPSPAPIVVSSGTRAENLRLVEELGLQCPVLLQDDMEASRSYSIRGSPSSRVIDEYGRFEGQTLRGSSQVLIQAGIMPGPDWSSETTRYVSVGNQFHRLVVPRIKDAIENPELELPVSLHPSSLPLVSVILSTRDRPGMLALGLDCYRRQTYSRRELIVVDDGTNFPADAEAISAVGGRIIRVPEGTPLGAKLNLGASESRGTLCQKWDDDDWYAPRFLEVMTTEYLRHSVGVCRPLVAFQLRRIWFDLARWRILGWKHLDVSGGTLLFARKDWKDFPFREISMGEDLWFMLDHLRAGATLVPIDLEDLYVYVRHDSFESDRRNTWTHWSTGEKIEMSLKYRLKGAKNPADVLPDWAISAYRDLYRTLA